MKELFTLILLISMTLFATEAQGNTIEVHNIIQTEEGGSLQMTAKSEQLTDLDGKTFYKSSFEQVFVGNCDQSEGMHTLLSGLTEMDSTYTLTLSLYDITSECIEYQIATDFTLKDTGILWQVGTNSGTVQSFSDLVLVNWFGSGQPVADVVGTNFNYVNSPNFYKLKFSLSPP